MGDLCLQASLPNLVSTLKEQHSLSSSALLQTSSDESGNKRALYEKVGFPSHSTPSKACACSMFAA